MKAKYSMRFTSVVVAAFLSFSAPFQAFSQSRATGANEDFLAAYITAYKSRDAKKVAMLYYYGGIPAERIKLSNEAIESRFKHAEEQNIVGVEIISREPTPEAKWNLEPTHTLRVKIEMISENNRALPPADRIGVYSAPIALHEGKWVVVVKIN